MATKWGYLALLVSLTTLGVCFAVDDKDIGVAHRVLVTKDNIPPYDGIAHRIPVTKDKIPPSDGIAHRVPVSEDKIPPSDGISHWVPPRDDDNIHKDSIPPPDSIPEGIHIPRRPLQQSTESNYVNDPPPGAGGRVGGGRGGGGGGRYYNGDDCSIGMQPIYGRHPPSPPPLCQPTNPPLCQPTNPPPCPSNPPSCTPYPPCSQDCGWGGNGAASPQQPGLSGKGMRQDKENVFFDDYTVNQLIVAMQELTEVIKRKATP